MSPSRPSPPPLGASGRALWTSTTVANEIDAVQRVLLEEACRARDRLVWLSAIVSDDPAVVVAAAKEVRQQAELMRRMILAMRLPDRRTGKRPSRRPPRGAYQPRGS